MTQILKAALSKPGNILSLTLAGLVLAILVAVPAMMASHSTASEPTRTQLSVVLYQAGLDPEALAAAGVQAGQVSTLVTEAHATLTDRLDALMLAQMEHADAQRQVTALRRSIRAGTADQEAVSELANAQSAAATAQSSIDTIRAEVFAAATAHLDGEVVTRLHTVAGNRRWRLPIQYAVRDRSEAEWVALREALANTRISADIGEEADPASMALVAGENSRPEVAQAATYLDTRLSEIRTAFDTAQTH